MKSNIKSLPSLEKAEEPISIRIQQTSGFENIFFRCVEDCNEAIMMSDANGIIVYVNPAWQKIYGYTSSEAVGQTPRLLHSGSGSPEFYKKMWAQILDPAIGHWKGELINRARDGTLVPVLLTITPMRKKTGEIEGFMGIALDMTQSKDLEFKITHQDRLASVGLLASGLAHEVGTPLGVVRGRAEYLLMKENDPVATKNLEVIISQTDRITKLIRSLLRVGRNSSVAHIDNVRLLEVADEVFSLVGQNIRADAAEIRVSIEPELTVKADFGRLEQVLLNLVMNSIHAIRKSMKEGRTGPHFFELVAKRENDKILIEATDSGCGIAPENMKKLFRPFFTTKEIGEGTGLGLAIASQLLREMNGEIRVKSTLNVGTTFTLILNP